MKANPSRLVFVFGSAFVFGAVLLVMAITDERK